MIIVMSGGGEVDVDMGGGGGVDTVGEGVGEGVDVGAVEDDGESDWSKST